MIPKDSWVQIKKVVLEPEQRASHLPEATQKVPLLLWVKGHLLANGEIGSIVEIRTLTGRKESGVLVCQNPSYMHTYGVFVPEILHIDEIVKKTLYGGDFGE